MNDVDILCKSLLKFHEIIFKHTTLEVLFDSSILTVSSLALKTFKKSTKLDDLLGVEPECGYNSGKQIKPQSKIAITWLNDVVNNNIDDKLKFRWIFHPLGEKKVGGFYVDGYDESNNVIYEFLGCYFHGCSDCFESNAFNYKCEKTFGKLKSETSSRLNHLKNYCSKVIIMKECQYLKKEKKIYDNFRYPLKIRDSLYGGRTSPVALFKDCSNGGKIYYVDFVSLYPSIQFENYFPVGDHSIMINQDDILKFVDQEMKKKEEKKCGFIKCDILPPRNIFFPVLPTKIDEKLLFVLCFECGKLKDHSKKCQHSEEERMLCGTWCLHEIYEAIRQGYVIKKTSELIYYEKKMKIFEKFISKFFVLKTQYSGLKNDTEIEKEELSCYLLKEFGIYVKPCDISSDRNEAMRYVMKLILNSLWGKLCQNPNKSSVHFVENAEELASYVYDEKYENVHFDILDSHVARVVCELKENCNHNVGKVCVSVGSYITCYSRLKLLKELVKLPQESVLYYDTDSIIYYSQFCDELIDIGDKLGEMHSELKHDEHITSFVSTGPKSYSYITNKNKEVIHVKGFKMIKSKSSVNPDMLYEIVENNDVIHRIENQKFKINKNLHISKNDELKLFKFTFDKRQILPDLSTIPWGM